MSTLLQLRTSTRVAADQDNSTYPTDVALNDIINRATRTVWRRMVAVGWKPDRTIQLITPTGATSYTLTSTVSTVQSVMFLSVPGSNAVRTPLMRVKPEQLPDVLTAGLGTQAVAYDLIGGGIIPLSIELYPPPPAGGTGVYEVRYTERFVGFSSDTDQWFGPDGSDEVIICTAALESIMKEGDPAGTAVALEKRLNKCFADVVEAAGWMDSQGQQTVRDVYRNHRRGLAGDYMVSDGWDM